MVPSLCSALISRALQSPGSVHTDLAPSLTSMLCSHLRNELAFVGLDSHSPFPPLLKPVLLVLH